MYNNIIGLKRRLRQIFAADPSKVQVKKRTAEKNFSRRSGGER
jgi:hypothetical protein